MCRLNEFIISVILSGQTNKLLCTKPWFRSTLFGIGNVGAHVSISFIVITISQLLNIFDFKYLFGMLSNVTKARADFKIIYD